MSLGAAERSEGTYCAAVSSPLKRLVVQVLFLDNHFEKQRIFRLPMFLKCFYYFTVSTLTIEKRQPWDRVLYRILTCQKSKIISIRLLENRVFARRECYKNTESSHLIELQNRLRNFEPVKKECHIPQHPAKNDIGGQSHQYFHKLLIF